MLLTNSDVIVTPDCIERLERTLELEPDAGIAGPAVCAVHSGAHLRRSGCPIGRPPAACAIAGFGDEIRRCLARRRIASTASAAA